MTQKEKEHKLKLISLIFIVEIELIRKKEFKSALEQLSHAFEVLKWANEFKKIKATKIEQ